jgi:hypothetical protein
VLTGVVAALKGGKFGAAKVSADAFSEMKEKAASMPPPPPPAPIEPVAAPTRASAGTHYPTPLLLIS